jgi:hypothetical protein
VINEFVTFNFLPDMTYENIKFNNKELLRGSNQCNFSRILDVRGHKLVVLYTFTQFQISASFLCSLNRCNERILAGYNI